MALTTVPVELANLDGAVTVNESSADVDFRIESNGQTHALFVDGALDNVGIGYSAAHTATNKGLAILTGDGNGGIQLIKEDGSYPSSGETLGSIGWKGADSANSNAAAEASIVAIAAENFSGSAGATHLAFNTKGASTGPGSAPTERMRLDSTGVLRFKGGTDTTGSSAEESFITHDNGGNTSLRIGSNYSNDNAAIRLQNNTTEIAVFKKAGVTMPLQPAFMVQKSSTQADLSENETITWDTERFDIGSNFASNTFTAPVTGKYQLNMNIRVDSIDSDATYIIFRLNTSNRAYDSLIDARALDADPAYWMIQRSELVDMDANDTAYISHFYSGGSEQADVSTDASFSGFLAC